MEQKLLDDWVQNEWLRCMIPYIGKSDFYKDNPYLSLKLIENNMELPWNWNKLSELEYVTAKFAFTHSNKTWDWQKIIQKPDFAINMINEQNKICLTHKHWYYICSHLCIDMEYVNEHMNLPWNWKQLTFREKCATSQNILRYPDMPWDWEHICKCSRYADMSIVLRFPDKPWHGWGLSQNSNLSLEIIAKFVEKIAPHADTTVLCRGFETDKYNYILSQQIRLSLISILEYYEMATHSYISTIHNGDFIFSNNYLVKNIMNFL